MRRRKIARLLTALSFAALTISTAQAKDKGQPNFLIIVADDLGWSDLGAFGGEIRTPNLDALANRGVRFTNFHTAPACSPTRAMLLTGTDPHRVGLGAMEMVTPNQKGKRGLEGWLRPDNATLAELLAANGYRTLLSGKWHLGDVPGRDPHDRGFQRSFAILPAAHNHFGLGLATDPTKGVVYTEDGRIIPKLPENFYSSDAIADHMVGYLKEKSDKPFFAYLAFTAPHAPLQAPPEDIARYKGIYDAGFDALRTKRLERLATLGLADPAKPAHARIKPPGGWDALSPEEKAESARAMEVYAAMVDRLDQNVGRVIAELKRSGKLDNTVILFLSDNGAEGMAYDDAELPSIKKRHDEADNSLGNLGAATSFIGYGPGWASASAAPSWLYKTYATEGGTRTVSFIAGPAGITGSPRIGRAYLTAADVVPTFLALAKVPDPKGRFAGRDVEPIQGTSLLPWLGGKTAAVHGRGGVRHRVVRLPLHPQGRLEDHRHGRRAMASVRHRQRSGRDQRPFHGAAREAGGTDDRMGPLCRKERGCPSDQALPFPMTMAQRKTGKLGGMRLIRGGTFRMGSEDFYPEEAPVRTVTVGDFWMDETPVTNDAFAAFVAATGYLTFAERFLSAVDFPGYTADMLVPGSSVFQPPADAGGMAFADGVVPAWWRFVPDTDWRHPLGPASDLSGMGAHPVVHVVAEDAEAYAAWAGKALPSEAEWEYAARGGLDGAAYAWGEELEPEGRRLAHYWQGRFPAGNEAPPGLERTAPVRSYPANPYGLYDMIANVWEWTADWYSDADDRATSCCGSPDRIRDSMDPDSPVAVPRRVLKGGSHLCAANYCRRYRPAARWPQAIDTSTSHIGFRCIVRR